jgi:hypothetical protein
LPNGGDEARGLYRKEKIPAVSEAVLLKSAPTGGDKDSLRVMDSWPKRRPFGLEKWERSRKRSLEEGEFGDGGGESE